MPSSSTDIDVLQTHNPQAGRQVFIIGDLAVVMNAGYQRGDGDIFFAGQNLQDRPISPFQANGCRVTVKAHGTAFGFKFLMLLDITKAKKPVQWLFSQCGNRGLRLIGRSSLHHRCRLFAFPIQDIHAARGSDIQVNIRF